MRKLLILFSQKKSSPNLMCALIRITPHISGLVLNSLQPFNYFYTMFSLLFKRTFSSFFYERFRLSPVRENLNLIREELRELGYFMVQSSENKFQI